jgi:hypothetical protein
LGAIAYFREILERLLKDYQPKELLESKLLDKQTGYHKYFGVVYQLEKVRVLEMHLRLLNIAVRVIEKLRKGILLK